MEEPYLKDASFVPLGSVEVSVPMGRLWVLPDNRAGYLGSDNAGLPHRGTVALVDVIGVLP